MAGRGYRPDIDGLRALAILPVVLNHARIKGFSGGYVGVDIFFVISGFLITSILVRELSLQRHSIAQFYRRRVLRIFPALFAVLAVGTVVACVVLMPGELVSYGRSLVATALFASNMLFYSETGYFDTAARAKPLLHTWSLAIEEQFYILWPLMLAAVGARRTGFLKATVAAVTLVSLALSIWLVSTNASAAFYLLPTRAWELSLGGLVALAGGLRRRWLNETMGVVGLALILYAIWAYDELTSFPGAAALAPCVGAALLLASGGAGTLIGRLMSIGPAVLTGRISYSLYLWHWPVIVFAQLGLFLPTTQLVGVAEVALAATLGFLSWRFVEEPFRGARAASWKTRDVLLAGLCAMAATVAVGGVLIGARGLASRFTPEQTAMAAFADRDEEAGYRRGRCFIVRAEDQFDAAGCLKRSGGRPVLLLVGDSHAAHFWPGLSRHLDRYDVLQATMVGCRPMLYPDADRARCARFFGSMGDWSQANKPDAILLAGHWQSEDVPLLRGTLAALKRQGTTVVLIGPAPQYSAALPRLLTAAARRNDPALPSRSLDRSSFAVDQALAALSKETGTAYVSPMQRLCDGAACRTLAAPGVPLQFDVSHLTRQGSAVVVDLLMPGIDAAVRDAPATGER